jgi:hypothetical protein
MRHNRWVSSAQADSWRVTMWLRKVRVPAVVGLGVLYVLLPGEHYWLLVTTIVVFLWLPGFETIWRNFRNGYREDQRS